MTDSEAGTIDTVSAAAIRTIMPPYLVVQNFLEEETVAGLLDHALAHEAEFAPTRTGRAETGGTRPHVRVSVSMRNLGPFRPILKNQDLRPAAHLDQRASGDAGRIAQAGDRTGGAQ